MVKIFLLSILLLIGGCSSKKNEQWFEFRTMFIQGEYQKAEEFLQKSDIHKEPKDQLLVLMERGNLKLQLGQAKEAQAVFLEAIDLVDAQYTKSIREKAAKYIINDTRESFYGALYERSWLFYYAAIASYRLYLEDPIKNRDQLFKARALMLAWDSFFQEIQRMSDKKTVYQHDLVAKIFAAQVHEATGIKADLQISLQLYKDGLSLLNSWGGVFASFNQEATDYLTKVQSSFEKGDTPKNLPWKKSSMFAQTESYLKNKINELSKNKPTSNVTLFLEEGIIPLKKVKKINIGLRGAVSSIKDEKTRRAVEDVGAAVITYFAMETLGLNPTPQNYSPGRFAMAHNLTNVAAREAAIEFEVPIIEENNASLREYSYLFKDSTGKIISRSNLVMVTNLGELSQLVLDEEATQRIFRTGLRVATKYLAAIAASYAVYRQLGNGENTFLASTAAMGTFIAASKAISSTERADVRAWSTLPRVFRVSEVKLDPGVYDVELVIANSDQNAPSLARSMGKINVLSSSRTIFAHRAPQL